MRSAITLAAALVLVLGACRESSKRTGGPVAPASQPATPASLPHAGRPEAARPPDPIVERGRYLVENVMACGRCHTPVAQDGKGHALRDAERRLAGGLTGASRHGTWRSPNITPDADTGIGRWTDVQILEAVRGGVRPDRSRLHPIMPYLFYRALTEEDGRAVVAYLRTVRAVASQVPRNVGLTMPPVEAKEASPEAAGKDPIAMGRYLARLMTCTRCHTPTTADGRLDRQRLFAGGVEMKLPGSQGTVYSANLTPDRKTGLGPDAAERVANAIQRRMKRDGKPIAPPMALYAPYWQGVTRADALAVAAFLGSLKPIANRVPASTFRPAAAAPRAGSAPPKR